MNISKKRSRGITIGVSRKISIKVFVNGTQWRNWYCQMGYGTSCSFPEIFREPVSLVYAEEYINEK